MVDSQLDWGLLWLDDSDKSLHEKVKGATTHYRVKHGRYPNLCYVHPSALDRGICDRVGDVVIVARKSVLPHHFWIGVEKEKNDGHQ